MQERKRFKGIGKRIICMVVAFAFLLNSISPAWARNGNYGEKSSGELFSLGCLVGLVSYYPNPLILIGSNTSNLVGFEMYQNHYNEYGATQFSFHIGGTEVKVTKGQWHSMVASIIATAVVALIVGALAGAGSAAAEGAVEGAAKGATEGAVNGAVQGTVNATAEATVKEAIGTAVKEAGKAAAKEAAPSAIKQAAKSIIKAIVEFIKKHIFGTIKDAIRSILPKAIEKTVMWAVDFIFNTAANIIEAALSVVINTVANILDFCVHPIRNIQEWIEGIKEGFAPKTVKEMMGGNRYFIYGQSKEFGKAAVQLGVDLASGAFRLSVQEAGKEISMEKWGWDETVAEVAGQAASSYLGPIFERTVEGVTLDTINVVLRSAGLNTMQIGGAAYVDKDGKKAKVKTGELVRVNAKGEILDGEGKPTGKSIKGRPDALLIVPGGKDDIKSWKDLGVAVGSIPLSPIWNGSFSQGHLWQGLGTLGDVGLGPLTQAAAKIAVLQALDYTTYRGSNDDKIYDNVVKMAIANAAGYVAGNAGQYVTDSLRGDSKWSGYNGYLGPTVFTKAALRAAEQIAWAKFCKANNIESSAATEVLRLAASSWIAGTAGNSSITGTFLNGLQSAMWKTSAAPTLELNGDRNDNRGYQGNLYSDQWSTADSFKEHISAMARGKGPLEATNARLAYYLGAEATKNISNTLSYQIAPRYWDGTNGTTNKQEDTRTKPRLRVHGLLFGDDDDQKKPLSFDLTDPYGINSLDELDSPDEELESAGLFNPEPTRKQVQRMVRDKQEELFPALREFREDCEKVKAELDAFDRKFESDPFVQKVLFEMRMDAAAVTRALDKPGALNTFGRFMLSFVGMNRKDDAMIHGLSEYLEKHPGATLKELADAIGPYYEKANNKQKEAFDKMKEFVKKNNLEEVKASRIGWMSEYIEYIFGGMGASDKASRLVTVDEKSPVKVVSFAPGVVGLDDGKTLLDSRNEGSAAALGKQLGFTDDELNQQRVKAAQAGKLPLSKDAESKAWKAWGGKKDVELNGQKVELSLELEERPGSVRGVPTYDLRQELSADPSYLESLRSKYAVDIPDIQKELENVSQGSGENYLKGVFGEGKRVAVLGESHDSVTTKKYLTDILPVLKSESNVKYLGVELDHRMQDDVDYYMKTGKVTAALENYSGFKASAEGFLKLFDAAKKEGIKVFCFDSRGGNDMKSWDLLGHDEDMANRIIDVQKKDPTANVLVLVGSNHLNPTEDGYHPVWEAIRLQRLQQAGMSEAELAKLPAARGLGYYLKNSDMGDRVATVRVCAFSTSAYGSLLREPGTDLAEGEKVLLAGTESTRLFNSDGTMVISREGLGMLENEAARDSRLAGLKDFYFLTGRGRDEDISPDYQDGTIFLQKDETVKDYRLDELFNRSLKMTEASEKWQSGAKKVIDTDKASIAPRGTAMEKVRTYFEKYYP